MVFIIVLWSDSVHWELEEKSRIYILPLCELEWARQSSVMEDNIHLYSWKENNETAWYFKISDI